MNPLRVELASDMDNATLTVFSDSRIIFQSGKRWLHPLFELEEFLIDHPVDMSHTEVHDKVVGKAAAMLIAHLGAGSVHGEVMSELGRKVFVNAGIPHTYGTLVERIDCQTEEVLLEINDLNFAHQILVERAKRSEPENPDC